MKLVKRSTEVLDDMLLYNKLIGIELIVSSYTFNCIEHSRHCNMPVLENICTLQHARLKDILNQLASRIVNSNEPAQDLNALMAGTEVLKPLDKNNIVPSLISAHAEIIYLLNKEMNTQSDNSSLAGYLGQLVATHHTMLLELQQTQFS